MFWTILWMLIFGHALADYALQSGDMAVGKNSKLNDGENVPWPYWLLAHGVIHGGVVTILTGSVWLGFAECIIHTITDKLKCSGIINLHQDQAIHIASKAAWAGIIISLMG
jgi:Protein of unknown function (DUF3307)